MANEKEKVNASEENLELYQLTAADIYSRAVRIGVVFGYLRNLWRQKLLFLPNDPNKREDTGKTVDLAPLFGTESASMLSYSLASILPNAITERKTLDKVAAAQALKNFEDAWAVVRALPSPLLDLADGDSVPNTEKAVCYYFARRPEGSADQWIVRYEDPGDARSSSKTIEEMKLLKSIFSRLTEFYIKATDNGRKQRTPAMFLDFIWEELEVLDSLQEVRKIQEAQAEPVLSIGAKVPRTFDYPLDKINAQIWDLLETPTGQLTFAMEKAGSGEHADCLFAINFDQLEGDIAVIKKLNTFDKRCYTAVASLWNEGNYIMTASQIYSFMGLGEKAPSSKKIQEINNSLTKMGAARVYIDNSLEVAVNKGYPKFVYDASLLPFERITAKVNGKQTDSAIHVFREPPLISFAKGRKQITTLPRALLNSPINKTSSNLRLEDYLLERISHIKKGRLNPKILYATIWKSCNFSDKKQKQRARNEYIPRLLNHYQSCGFITGFSAGTDGVTIRY